MTAQERPYEPPLLARAASAFDIGIVGFLSRTFLFALSKTQTHGLQNFLDLLDKRKDETKRERGLITVSNHLSILDDPMIWGALPYRYHWHPNNMRWSLGSHDICFKKGSWGVIVAFFNYGNTLPIRRLAHSEFGGLFQPTMTEVIRLLSDPHRQSMTEGIKPPSFQHSGTPDSLPRSDPFSSAELTYSTDGIDSFPAPSVYPSRRFSWVHIFPEGMIHQHPRKVMRYFKWGVARLILEAEPCPDVLPMWIDGPQEALHEKREWPRPIPRPGKEISISFGELIDRERVLEPLRERWRALKEHSRRKREVSGSVEQHDVLGELQDEDLKYGPEAQQLRIDVTLAVRNEVLKLRRSQGLPDEDPKRSLAATYRAEGYTYGKLPEDREGEMQDGSVIKDT